MVSDEGEKSAFNEGALQMRRIDELQSRLNFLNMNPTHYDNVTREYNYVLIFRTIKALYSESSSKLSKEELVEAEKYLTIINDAIKLRPPHIIKGNINDALFNQHYWNVLETLLLMFEKRVRRFLEDHDLTSPKAESEGGWD